MPPNSSLAGARFAKLEFGDTASEFSPEIFTGKSFAYICAPSRKAI
ncbi:MAG: hypothetical protein AAB316_05190 [Bacteroidota bacterium]